MAESLTVKENQPGLDVVKAGKERPLGADAIDKGRQQATELRRVVARKPSDLADEIGSVVCLIGPDFRPAGTPPLQVAHAAQLEAGSNIVQDSVNDLREIGFVLNAFLEKVFCGVSVRALQILYVLAQFC